MATLLAALLGGCGQPSGSPPTTSSGATVTPPSSGTGTGGTGAGQTGAGPSGGTGTSQAAYTAVGGFDVSLPESSGGGTATITYSVGQPIISNSIPAAAEEMAASCHIIYTQGDVWVPAQATITFHGGPHPQAIPIIGGDIIDVVGDYGDSGVGVIASPIEAIDVEGTWACGEGQDGDLFDSPSLTFDPGQSVTMSIWVVSMEGVNNVTPTWTESEYPGWSFNAYTLTDEFSQDGNGTGASITSVFGPHAMQCTTYSGLLVSLFATPPFTHKDQDGDTDSCHTA